MNYYLHKFGAFYATATALPVLGAEQQIGPDPVLPTNIVLPGGGTFDSRGTDQALPSGHTVMARGFYSAASEAALQVLVDAMRGWIGKRTKLWLYCADATVRWRYARLLSAPTQHLARGHGRFRQAMELTFELDDMLWQGRHLLTAGGVIYDSPEIVEVNNPGNQVVRDIRITVAADTYDITQLDIENAEVGHVSHIRFTGTIVAGESLVIDCGEMTVENEGVDAWDDLSRQSAHEINEWLRFAAKDSVLVLGSEMATYANAASDPNENEANATTGWGVLSDCAIASSSVSPLVGEYCLKGTAGSESYDAITYNFTAVIGRVYRVSFWAKRGAQGTNQATLVWDGVEVSPNFDIESTTWTEYIGYVTADETTVKVKVFAAYTGGASGDEVYVDNLSVRRILSSGDGDNTITIDRHEELGAEKHTQANAASDPNGNEANATTGWSTLGALILTSSGVGPHEGDWCLKGLAGDAANEGMKYSFTAVIGKFYKIVIWARRGAQGTTQRFYNWQGCTGADTINITSESWIEYTFQVCATATTIEIRAYANAAGAANDAVKVDNVSIKEVTGGGSPESTCKFRFNGGYA